jgi:hypothetical protein
VPQFRGQLGKRTVFISELLTNSAQQAQFVTNIGELNCVRNPLRLDLEDRDLVDQLPIGDGDKEYRAVPGFGHDCAASHPLRLSRAIACLLVFRATRSLM